MNSNFRNACVKRLCTFSLWDIKYMMKCKYFLSSNLNCNNISKSKHKYLVEDLLACTSNVIFCVVHNDVIYGIKDPQKDVSMSESKYVQTLILLKPNPEDLMVGPKSMLNCTLTEKFFMKKDRVCGPKSTQNYDNVLESKLVQIDTIPIPRSRQNTITRAQIDKKFIF